MQWSRKNKIKQLRYLVCLLKDIKLKARWGKLKTYDKMIEDVGFTDPEPITLEVDPSIMVTGK